MYTHDRTDGLLYEILALILYEKTVYLQGIRHKINNLKENFPTQANSITWRNKT